MSKNYTLIKTTPSEVLFFLHPVSNMSLTRKIYLNKNVTRYALPEDWALGVFQDEGVYQMYKQGLFTFDDNESIVKAAFEAGVYFGDELDFEPAKQNEPELILAILKKGNRSEIVDAVEKYGQEKVGTVAMTNIDSLTQSVIKMLENILKVQLTLNVD